MFLNKGEVTIKSADHAIELLSPTNYFKLDRLKAQCEELISKGIEVENAAYLLQSMKRIERDKGERVREERQRARAGGARRGVRREEMRGEKGERERERNFTANNIFVFFSVASQNEAWQLKNFALDYIMNKYDEVSLTNAFIDLDKPLLLEVTQAAIKFMKK